MTTQHTPGPWEIDGEYVQQAGQASVAVCDVMVMDEGGDKGWYRGSVTQANARLIAAAPELLGALEGLLAVSVDTTPEELLAMMAARDAIAKAKGAQQ